MHVQFIYDNCNYKKTLKLLTFSGVSVLGSWELKVEAAQLVEI